MFFSIRIGLDELFCNKFKQCCHLEETDKNNVLKHPLASSRLGFLLVGLKDRTWMKKMVKKG